MEKNNILSENLINLREKFGYSGTFVADYLGVTPQAVTQYENNSRSIPVAVVEKLALLYNVSEYDLYEKNPERQCLLSSFAFRANEFTAEDMVEISKFKKIIYNYINMATALKNEN